MEYRRDSRGLLTFLEHWYLPLFMVGAPVANWCFFGLARLHGGWWLGACVAAIVLQVAGAGMIAYAKAPVYRSGRWLTFGVGSVPADRAGCYRWGWRVFVTGVVVSLGLLMGKL